MTDLVLGHAALRERLLERDHLGDRLRPRARRRQRLLQHRRRPQHLRRQRPVRHRRQQRRGEGVLEQMYRVRLKVFGQVLRIFQAS